MNLVPNNFPFTRIWLALPLALVSKRTRCPIPSEVPEGKGILTILPSAFVDIRPLNLSQTSPSGLSHRNLRDRSHWSVVTGLLKSVFCFGADMQVVTVV